MRPELAFRHQFGNFLVTNCALEAWFLARVGVINVCSENDLYHNPRDVIITSQMAVSELVDNNNDNELPLAVQLVKFIHLKRP